MNNNIQNSVRIYNMIKDQLAHEYELLPEDQFLIDTLDGLTDLNEQITALVRDAVRAEAMADAIKIIIADNQTRKQKFEARAERLRSLALWALQEAGISKVDAPDMTISQVPGRASVKVDDDNLVPDELCRITRKPDLTAIGEKLKSGEFVPYARLSNVVPILRVKTT